MDNPLAAPCRAAGRWREVNDCPRCDELRREVDFWKRIDWRAWREAAQRLLDHQTQDHCFHIAVPKEVHHVR